MATPAARRPRLLREAFDGLVGEATQLAKAALVTRLIRGELRKIIEAAKVAEQLVVRQIPALAWPVVLPAPRIRVDHHRPAR